VRAQVGLKAESVDDGHVRRDEVEGRAWARPLAGDVAATPPKDLPENGQGRGLVSEEAVGQGVVSEVCGGSQGW
jgi:hypothetical protein